MRMPLTAARGSMRAQPRRVRQSSSGCWGTYFVDPAALSNPLMQPTNAGGAGRRSYPGLRPATKDHRFSQGRLQLIGLSLGTTPPSSNER
jgi:hypothetical protein